MKATHGIFVAGGVFLAGAFGYHWISRRDLPGIVEEQGVAIEKIAGETGEHRQRIEASDLKIEDHEARIQELAGQMKAVTGRVAETEKRLEEAVAQGQRNNEAAERLRGDLAILRGELESLKRDYDQRVQVVEELQKKALDQQQINEDIDRRLRNLEKTKGVPRVTP